MEHVMEHVVEGRLTRVLSNGLYKVAFLVTGRPDYDAFAERCARRDLARLMTGTLPMARLHDSEGAGSHGNA